MTGAPNGSSSSETWEPDVQLFNKSLVSDIVLVAEIGVNHEGDVGKALELIDLAAQAGADAVKFQSYTPARYSTAENAERLARVTRFALDEAAHRRLAERAGRAGLAFFSTPVTEDWAPLLAELGSAIKIASGDIDFEPVIRAAAATGLPVILSTGAADEAEIDRAVGWVRQEVGVEHLPDRLILMHCVSAYPTPIEQANLLAIPWMAERFAPVTVGYSNHVIGREAPLAAVALGARVIEVHFTDRKEGRQFHDHALSQDPDDLAWLAMMLPRIAAARGVYGKPVQDCERGMREAIRKGVVAAADLPAGRRLSRDDLMFARPATEIAAGEIDTLLGKTLTRAVPRGHLLRRDALDG